MLGLRWGSRRPIKECQNRQRGFASANGTNTECVRSSAENTKTVRYFIGLLLPHLNPRHNFSKTNPFSFNIFPTDPLYF